MGVEEIIPEEEENRTDTYNKNVVIVKNNINETIDPRKLPDFNYDDIKELETLGKGGFGSVFRALHKIDMNFLAIKFYFSSVDFESIKQEDYMMLAIKNMNIPETDQKRFLEYRGLLKSVRNGEIFFLLVMESW